MKTGSHKDRSTSPIATKTIVEIAAIVVIVWNQPLLLVSEGWYVKDNFCARIL